jgi:outer membrane receptor protein involved in Fe transport
LVWFNSNAIFWPSSIDRRWQYQIKLLSFGKPAGYRINKNTKLAIDIYNLLDKKGNDIEYAYSSQLANEAAPVFDRHIHPTEPRSMRVTLTHKFN